MLVGWYKIIVSKLVTRYWPLVIAGWLTLAVLLRLIAPAWEDIAADGDLAFLPATVPSAVGQATLQASFPTMRARSQMVIVFATPETALGLGDLALAFDMARRLHWSAAQNAWRDMRTRTAAPKFIDKFTQPNRVALQNPVSGDTLSGDIVSDDPVDAEVIVDNLTEAIAIEEVLTQFLQKEAPETVFERLPDAYALRGQIMQALGKAEDQEQAALDIDTAKLMIEQRTPTLPSELPAWAVNIQDVWSWRNPIVGHKLGSNEARARLINLQLSSDFSATSNIDTINGLEALARELRPRYAKLISPDLKIEVGGSAAVGADMLRAAASGVRKTELVTIVLVLLILSFVYRAPFLVAIPLTSIALSLVVATSLIALLARAPGTSDGYGLGVFTTTRIFIVVLLFGTGTDFCLFFLARNREILQSRPVHSRRQMYRVVATGWRSVHDALVASALTTIVGLALMWFSRFQKFQFSGPIIAISLAVTLVVCLSFTPALLSAVGSIAFWPQLSRRKQGDSDPANKNKPAGSGPTDATQRAGRTRRYWGALADIVVRYPVATLLGTLIVLGIPAIYGASHIGNVTYDLTEELSASAPSRRGARLISQFFPTQAGSPITIVLTRAEPFESEQNLRSACAALSTSLYTQGVDSVRSLTDPLGDYPPGKRMGLFGKDAWRRRLLNRITREHYVSSVNALQLRVARFDVVLNDNPFSLDAVATLQRVRELLEDAVSQPASPWSGARIATTGTTVGITDLRFITQGDQTRIQILVTFGVWIVLVGLLRQWVLSTYLIFTVLLSYFATLGITYWTFVSLYGASYSGLDWKVPLFLFVILVAVGQDYNVYLVTRIFEERRTAGVREGVRRALEATGGIITSCGFVMAGTFIAMTSPAVLLWLSGVLPPGLIASGWVDPSLPVLRGITELGFALACGVLLDTLIVRSILVPAFVVLWQPIAQARVHAKQLQPARQSLQ